MSENSEKPPLSTSEDLNNIDVALQKICKVLCELPDDASRVRVLRATVILLEIELGP